MPQALIGAAIPAVIGAVGKKLGGGGGSSAKPEKPSWLETLGPGLINTAGTLGGAFIGSRSASKGQDAQERANMAALQYQRERDMQGRQDFERAMRAYEANRNALLQRYGISVPQMQAGPLGPAPMPPGSSPFPPQGSGMVAPGMGPGQEMRRGPMQAQPLRGIPGNLGAFARGGYTGRSPY